MFCGETFNVNRYDDQRHRRRQQWFDHRVASIYMGVYMARSRRYI